MKTSIALSLGLLLAVIAVTGGIKAQQIMALIAQGESYVPPPEPVTYALAENRVFPAALRAIGTIESIEGTTVSSEVSGTIAELAFESGSEVTAGELLLRLDTSVEEANLRAVEARVDLARLQTERLRRLVDSRTATQADLDETEATLRTTQAEADALRAQIAKASVRAPFAGRLGVRLVRPGQFIDRGTPVVTLQNLARVEVDFRVPQQQIAALRSAESIRLTTNAHPGRVFEGRLSAVEPFVDPRTRNVRARAVVENADGALQPGLFVRVEAVLPAGVPVVAIPASAVLYAPYGDTVFVVERETAEGSAGREVVRQQVVRLGERRGDFVAVTEGLKAGDKVVTTGAFKLQPGMAVVPDNRLALPVAEQPRPTEG